MTRLFLFHPFVLSFYLSLPVLFPRKPCSHRFDPSLCLFFPSTFHYKVSTEAIKFKPQKYYFSSGLKLSSDSISAEAARLLHCDQISSDCLFLWTLPTWRVRQRLDSENTSPVIMSQPRVQKFKCGFFFCQSTRVGLNSQQCFSITLNTMASLQQTDLDRKWASRTFISIWQSKSSLSKIQLLAAVAMASSYICSLLVSCRLA